MKNRILYIGGFELPDKNAAAHRVLNNAKLFKKLGFEVVFRGITHDAESLESTVYSFESSSLVYPNSLLKWVKYLTSISDIKGMLNKSRFDCIIAYNLPAIKLYKLKKLCAKNNIKIIADCTEWYQPTGSLVKRVIKYIDTELRMRWVNKKLDGIILISDYLYNYYKKYCPCLTVIPPLVDKSENKWSNSKTRNRSSIVNVIYAGSPGVGEKDRLDIIVNVFESLFKSGLRNISLTIIGLTKSEYNRVFGSTQEFENIKFMGRITHDKVLEHLSSADFQIIIRDNSRANNVGFPTKFVEAVSIGTPVIINNTSNLKDFVEGNGILLSFQDESELENKLKSILSMSKEDIYQVKRNVQTDLFHYERYTTLMDNFFKKLN